MMQIEIPKPDMHKPIDHSYLWRLADTLQQYVDASSVKISGLQKEIQRLKEGK